MREVTISRPVTVRLLADLLDCKTFQLLADLIKRSVFLAPDQTLEDPAAIQLAAERGVLLRIRDGDPDAPESGSPPLALHPSRQSPPFHSDLGPDPDTLSPDDD